MVSLAAVEMMTADLWPENAPALVSIPDARKGERLILFTQEKGATRAAYQSFAKGRGASDVAIPAEVAVLDAIPMLGTGKVDQVAVTKLALERAKENAAA